MFIASFMRIHVYTRFHLCIFELIEKGSVTSMKKFAVARFQPASVLAALHPNSVTVHSSKGSSETGWGRVRPSIAGEMWVAAAWALAISEDGEGILQVDLQQAEKVILYDPALCQKFDIQPVTAEEAQLNCYGSRKRTQRSVVNAECF
jgi:hypothetical protein